MAIGDEAVAAGYPLVPPTGQEGLVRWGAREINRTRDFIAAVKGLIPVGKEKYRQSSGISSGYDDPKGGEDRDIYFKIVG